MARRNSAFAAILCSPLALAGGHGAASAENHCLTVKEQRAAIRSGEAVRPAVVRRSVGGGEVLRLSLCVGGDGLVWRVVVLGRNGRVSDHLVDASDGALIR